MNNMNQQKTDIYLAAIVRSIKYFGASPEHQNVLNNLESLTKEVESKYSSIIDAAYDLAKGQPKHISDSDIPQTTMDCLLESIGNSKEVKHKFPARPISISKDFFPAFDQGAALDTSLLKQRVFANLSKLCFDDKRILAENILQILFRYACTIPSDKKNLDISLYDQVRIAASLAVCIFEHSHDSESAKKPFLLIGADFSGIQNYIYQIVSKHAGKNLKGRSFYLRLLSDSIVSYLLQSLELFSANIIYDSGGCFYLLAPNTKDIKTRLDKAINHIELQLLKAHGTTLFVAIDSVEISKDELCNVPNNESLSQKWQSLFVKRDKKKYSKFAGHIQDQYNIFFEPKDVDGNKRDAITGWDFSKEDKVVKFNGNQFISELSDAQIQLGSTLKDCDCIVGSNVEIDAWKDKTNIRPANIGKHYYLLSIKELNQSADVIEKNSQEIIIQLLNGRHGDCDYTLLPTLSKAVVCLSFYGGNFFNGNTFEQMCDNDNLSRLGVLRMDVDNLGNIFQNGLPLEKACLARFAALSRSFDYFFSGYINSIVLRDEYIDKSFIVYSGGDDLFIVGEWNTVINIAKDIREDFRLYTCGNPIFSISGGIAILTAKFPIINGAEESAIEESRAKKHTCNGHSKDSISMMDTPLHWSKEFPAVEKLKNKLVSLLLKKDLPKSFLSKIMLHASMADFAHHKIKNMKTYWMMSYDMKRMMERTNSTEVICLASNCQKDIWENGNTINGEFITTDYHLLELWAFACRWAELEYRMLN